MKKFFTNVIPMWIMVIMVLLSACQKEASESPLEGLVPTCDTTTMVASEEVTGGDTTEHQLLMPRVSVNINLNLSKFRYVWQQNTMKEWKMVSKYNTSGYCGYPRYIGAQTMITESNLLCGLASFMMAQSLVPHDTRIGIPTTNFDKAMHLSELVKRYQLFHSGYILGNETYITYLRDLANGTSSQKGEFTDWGNCSQKQISATTLVYYPKSDPTSRTKAKEFIRTQLQKGRPLIAIVSIDGTKGNAYNAGYLKTSGGIGHMVVIVGVTEDDINKVYQIRFKDPYTGNSTTYAISYTLFLDSMISTSANYNLLAFIGQ